MLNNPLIYYRLSGWALNLSTLILAYFAIKSKNIWKGRFVFMGLYFCVMAITELIASVAVYLLSNTQFIDYFYIPIIFILRILYLSHLNRSKKLDLFSYFLIFLFVIFQVYLGIDKNGYNQYNSIGSYTSSGILIAYCLRNLTLLFKEKFISQKLRLNPDFWFTITILCIHFRSIIENILASTSYIAANNTVIYIVFITSNFIKVFFLYGYYKGIKLLG